MPVPVWDSPDIGLLEEPLDTVLSDDIWKKFDLDTPLDMYTHHHDCTYEDNVQSELYGKDICYESRKIRHHDCMWAGLCISKEHNRTLPAKKDSQVHRRVPAGRSLLISRVKPSQQSQPQAHYQQHRRNDSLESDGDSTRPETPQSSTESDTESECDAPIFKHDQISINEKLSECMSMAKAAPVSEVTGQLVRKCPERRKVAVASTNHGNPSSTNIVAMETEIRNTLSDHCYHINQPNTMSMENLGVQTPSDSEEIDVVNFEKPCRPTVLLRHPNSTEQQVFRRTGFKEKPERRPRGRPRKIEEDVNQPKQKIKQEHDPEDQEPEPVAKRPKQRTYQRKTKIPKSGPPTPMSSPMKSSSSSSRSSSDDEPDIQKRNLHNDMERRRRIDLRNAYEDLRRLVPEIQDKERAAKVTILRQSAKYCSMLKDIDENSISRISELRMRQKKLYKRLQVLRRYFALTR
ncbi:N-myc proto-oncogene protein isoform X2 [Diachasma alloeum]|uniref:N-myc proto-oncogene protein isoform X2 n=1 Tax=Diachasma alloeum TaxID=454923 RepID=UPI000738489C|nr:N-myc proto-oncogene protein isoform X2 [Diachasma alloeum]